VAFLIVIAGLDPAIHADLTQARSSDRYCALMVIMDARVKPGHDEIETSPAMTNDMVRL
jgi:hypothetical protein